VSDPVSGDGSAATPPLPPEAPARSRGSTGTPSGAANEDGLDLAVRPPLALGLPAPVNLDDLLEPFARRGVDLGLKRLEAALAEGGHPERRFAAVQVAGTNGKGSICTLLHAILRAAGLRCASYRSPHLVSWCERIQLDDGWISPDQLRADLARWQPIGRRHQLTPFELLTAAAFDRFAAESPDLVILEVGLGGRLDATTAHPQRSLLGFGSIGLDHREHLGSTLTAIAHEKAAVMGPGSQAFSAPQHPEVAEVLSAEARRLHCDLHWLEPLAAPADGGPPLGLAGAWQRSNAAVAQAMAQALGQRGWPVDAAAIARGLADARWPGRLERRLWRGRELLLDGAHNPPAAAALRQEFDRQQPRRWLLGIQRHKQAPELLDALLAPGDAVGVVAIPDHRSWSAAELLAERPSLAGRIEALPELTAGLDWVTAAGPLPVVTGSLHLLGALIPLLDPAEPG
jgi:dihydrofolate synthase / folylpolyglutamate synthase